MVRREARVAPSDHSGQKYTCGSSATITSGETNEIHRFKRFGPNVVRALEEQIREQMMQLEVRLGMNHSVAWEVIAKCRRKKFVFEIVRICASRAVPHDFVLLVASSGRSSLLVPFG